MAISREDIEHLAKLSRVAVSEEEIERFQGDLEEILGYVSEIKNVSTGELEPVLGEHCNVLRDDTNPHDGGLHQEDLLNALPDREGNYARVKKIL